MHAFTMTRAVGTTLAAVALCVASGLATAKLPAPTEEQKAKACVEALLQGGCSLLGDGNEALRGDRKVQKRAGYTVEPTEFTVLRVSKGVKQLTMKGDEGNE